MRLYADWKASFIDGSVSVPSENNVAFPFGIVQIGPYSVGDNEQYGSVRWHQTVDQGVLPNGNMLETFMAASYDTTDPDSPTGDIHPRDKQTIADRLSNSAKWLLYNEAHSIYGPYPISAEQLMPGVMTITYNEDIVVQNTTGFTYKLSTGEWISTSISSVQGRQVQVPFDPAATQLAYGYLAVVCDYKRASIYASNSERLPAQIWLWKF
ncbi:hypothetical protein B566_EDAN009300 [Ephemera danica]|nr:hypothetical protein B566_EDAN009300 [Ephemera danica]